jgi:hypothetical protein
LRALPGVESAGLAVVAIIERQQLDTPHTVEGYPKA